MATRRRGTKGKAGRKAPARRRSSRTAGRRTRGRVSAARKTRRRDAARELRARGTPVAPAERPPGLRLADPVLLEEGTGRSEAADRDAAELARRIEATVAGAAEGLRTGPASAADQLRAHREEMEEAARRQEEERDLPGVAMLGVELAVGAFRLVRAVATAPLRLGLAFLRRGGESA